MTANGTQSVARTSSLAARRIVTPQDVQEQEQEQGPEFESDEDLAAASAFTTPEAADEAPTPPPAEPKKRGRKPGSKMVKKAAATTAAPNTTIELTDQHYTLVGELTVLARKNGMAPGDYVAHMREMFQAWDLVEKAIP